MPGATTAKKDDIALDEASIDDMLAAMTPTPDIPLAADISQILGAAGSRATGLAEGAGTNGQGATRGNVAAGLLASADTTSVLADALRQGKLDAPKVDAKAALDALASVVDGKTGNEASNKRGNVSDELNAVGIQSAATTAKGLEDRAALHVQERVGSPAWRDEVGA
jgi:hypothetical protein